MKSANVSFNEKTIDAILRDLDHLHLPGVAIGVAIDGIPVYRKGFGLASMELPVTLTPQTRMRIYSITKHFTCLAYLLLCEDGKADIDDSIGKYLPELHPVTHRVTMRQLMGNTSGLRDACEIRWFFSGIESIVPARELLGLYRDMRDVNFAPGTAWCYNNGGFHILSAVIEKLEQQPLEEVFRKRIFEPVGMHDTLLRRLDTSFIQNSASAHWLAADGRYYRKCLPGELLGEGGIASTVDDMLRWLKHMASPVVGTAETWGLMTTSQKLRSGRETGYGLGLLTRLDTIAHSGGGLGSNAQMVRLPRAGLDVIALSNRSDVSTTELVARVLNAGLDIEAPSLRQKSKCVTGLFRSPDSGRVIQLCSDNDRQHALVDGVENWELSWTERDVLSTTPPFAWDLELNVWGDPAEPGGVRYESFGCTDELLGGVGEPNSTLHSIAGEYQSDALGVRVTVSVHNRGVTMSTLGRFGSTSYRLKAIGGNLWRATQEDGWGGIVVFEADDKTLTLRTSRTWQLRFRRVA